MLTKSRLLILFLGVMIFTSIIAPTEIIDALGRPVFGDPRVEAIKSIGRELSYGLLALLFTIATFNLVTTGRAARPGVITWGYAAFFLFSSLKLLSYGHISLSIQYFTTSVFFLTIFGFFLPKLSRKGLLDLQNALLAAACAHFLLIITNLPLAVAGLANAGMRFTGLAYNPNMLAATLALTSCCLPIWTRRIKSFNRRALLVAGSFAASYYLVLATLSRGGFVLLTLSFVINLYFLSKNGFRVLLTLSPFLIFPIWLSYRHSGAYQMIFEGRTNTRLHVWAVQIEGFLGSPLYGEPWHDPFIRFGENLYLGAARALGVFGLVFLISILYQPLLRCVRMGWRRQGLSPFRRQEYQIASAFFGLTVLSGLIEALLLGVISSIIYCFLIFDSPISAGEPRSTQSSPVSRA